jgi:hypothetical protein
MGIIVGSRETYQGEKTCGRRNNNNNNNNTNNNNKSGTIRIFFLLETPVLCLTAVMLADTWLSRL